MKNYVSYEKAMRDRAIKDGMGLYTLEIISPGKKAGKLGGAISMQGPANEQDAKAITEFMLGLMEMRAAREPSISLPEVAADRGGKAGA